MHHKPIKFKDLSLIYPHKTCFKAFSGEIRFRSRIAIIGRNGAGKSSLLKMLGGLCLPTAGELLLPSDAQFGYLPQVIDTFPNLSGGQRLNQLVTTILSKQPNVLLLDEPTNHLDSRNRRSLMQMLKHYPGTLILVSHDTDLISAVVDTLWPIEGGKITEFNGSYLAYQQSLSQKKNALEQALSSLARQKKEMHLALMKEQESRKHSRMGGEKKLAQRKWPTVRSHSKMAKAVTGSDRRLSQINQKKEQLFNELSSQYQPEIIQPKFKLTGVNHQKSLLSIQNAAIGYRNKPLILSEIFFQLKGGERVALKGANASGKSTFVKALLGDLEVQKTGEWLLPKRSDLGYLDQHYQPLNRDETVLTLMTIEMPQASHAQIRAHLNDFLFRKNAEVQIPVKELSGGEKARLSLALIAANPPKLLILDELTNNVDRETRTHLIEVLREFPGAMLVISHEQDFLEAIQIETYYQIHQAKVIEHANE